MRILGHFSLFTYTWQHVYGFRGLGSPNKNHSALCVSLLFLLVISPGISEDAECIRTDAIRYENTFLPDYKLPVDVDR